MIDTRLYLSIITWNRLNTREKHRVLVKNLNTGLPTKDFKVRRLETLKYNNFKVNLCILPSMSLNRLFNELTEKETSLKL